MSIEEIESGSALDLADWLKSEKAGELQKHLEKRILKLLFNTTDFHLLQQLAWIGTDPKDKPLLEREIAELNNCPAILPCGLGKKVWRSTCKVSRFVANHKLEILGGAALCATGIGLAFATGYTLSATACGVVVAGAGSIFKSEKKPNYPPQVTPPSSKIEIASSLPKLELPASSTELLVTSEGIWTNGEFFSNHELMQHSIIADSLAKYAQPFSPNHELMQHPILADSLAKHTQPSEPSPPIAYTRPAGPVYPENSEGVISRRFTIHGREHPHLHIAWINGINNSFEESRKSGTYIQSLTGGCMIAGIYNCTHGAVIDLLESAFLNHMGYSPITAKLLRTEWEAFHKANAHLPNAKLLQVCHSQGTIDVKNALQACPPEIRDRVMVVAIAPAAVVPKRLCFKSFNYASAKDFVHKLEPSPPPLVESLTIDDVIVPTFGEGIDDRGELIILTPHPDAKGIDHEFRSPTYKPVLERLLANYEQHKGEYLPGEKEHLE